MTAIWIILGIILYVAVGAVVAGIVKRLDYGIDEAYLFFNMLHMANIYSYRPYGFNGKMDNR